MSVMDVLQGARVLVTGGAGFVGSNLVWRLLEEGSTVVVLDDFTTGNEVNLPESRERLTVERGSVEDAGVVERLVGEVDYVIHAAARNIISSTRNPREDFAVNIGGTLNVLLAARELGSKAIVYTSSASVYGNPRYLPINEDDAKNILTPYSVSKFAGENYCKAFYECYGVSTRIVRYSNVFGPRQRPDSPYCGVIAKFFDWAASGQPVRIHGDGEQTRDYTYVSDAVEATLLALCSPKAEGQVYNIGSGRETSVNQLARMIIDICGTDVEPQHIDKRDIDNIRRRVLNAELIRRDLRWAPSVTIERGLRLTSEWLNEHEAWSGNAPG
ncbi:MAG: NAD-dependent epimerase/dehydratase family protein [bacterium]